MRRQIGEQPRICVRPTALLLAIFLFIPLSALGAAGDFVPRIYSTEGYLEVTAMGQNEENTASGVGTRWTDNFAVEQLRLYLDGFVYHPRFMQFLVRGTTGMYQERYNNNFATSFSESAPILDYEFRTKFLPEHPYNLELYTLRTTPFARQTTADTRATINQKGAIFNYNGNPFSCNLSVNSGDTKTRHTFSEYRNESATGSYNTGPFDNIAIYSHTDTSTSLNLHTVSDLSSFQNDIKMGDARLESKISQNRLKQDSPFYAPLDTDTSLWTEQFDAQLPWGFSTFASYNVIKNDLTTGATASSPQLEDISQTKASNFSLAHKLYDSVRTYYSFNQTRTETSSGNIDSVSNSLSGVYTKKIPDGRFTISGQATRLLTDQENAPRIVGETHTATLFGTFNLTPGYIDPATISIKVTSDTGALIDLQQNDYVVQSSGNTVQITIESLPPQIMAEGLPPSYPYAFQVTYSLLASNVRLETTLIGYGVNFSLFENLISPYYSRQHSVQAVLAGAIPGGPQDYDTTVLGIAVRKAPFALVTEQRIVKSSYSPEKSLRNTIEYAQRVSDTLNLSATAERTKTIYGQGSLGTRGYTEELTHLYFAMAKTVPRHRLTASLSSSFSQRRSTINTSLYAVTGNLSWKLGRLTVNMGSTINRAESTGSVGKQLMTSEYYYVTLSRRLF